MMTLALGMGGSLLKRRRLPKYLLAEDCAGFCAWRVIPADMLSLQS